MTYSIVAKGREDIGMRRTSNQDEIILLPNKKFYAVSDGMGALISGGETSQMVKLLLSKAIEASSLNLEEVRKPEYIGEKLKEIIIEVNNKIYEAGKDVGRDRFGATLSCVWIDGSNAIFANVGDSRGYIFTSGQLQQVTKDHNLAAYLVEKGEITAEEAINHPSSSRLLKYMGKKPPLVPDIFIEPLTSNCEILLCSDGLYGMLDNNEIAAILTESKSNVVDELIDAANDAGGNDNISVVHIKVDLVINEEKPRGHEENGKHI